MRSGGRGDEYLCLIRVYHKHFTTRYMPNCDRGPELCNNPGMNTVGCVCVQISLIPHKSFHKFPRFYVVKTVGIKNHRRSNHCLQWAPRGVSLSDSRLLTRSQIADTFDCDPNLVRGPSSISHPVLPASAKINPDAATAGIRERPTEFSSRGSALFSAELLSV